MSDVKELQYPLNRVVATLDAAELDGALEALSSVGVARDEIHVITPDDLGEIESPLTESGLTGFFHRVVLSFGADLSLIDQLHGEVAEHGRVIVTVPVDDDAEKEQMLGLLGKHSPHTLKFVGRWTVEDL